MEVSNADRVVFPEVGLTKGDVVAYYDRIAARAFPHLADRPLSMKRYPRGIGAPGFFQKNVPPHYPPAIGHFEVPRHATKKGEREVTVFPVLRAPDQLAYVANQGAIELHVPTARVATIWTPDRIVLDLDPPEGALDLVRRAAVLARDGLADLGLPTVPMSTGSKGYHVVANILPTVSADLIADAMHKVATMLAARHPDDLTNAFRFANRGRRVYLDWPRNQMGATVVAPYSLRARPRASVATPLAWNELETLAPDAFTLRELETLLDRPDTLAELQPVDAAPFVAAADDAFQRSGLVLETFDRFRS